MGAFDDILAEETPKAAAPVAAKGAFDDIIGESTAKPQDDGDQVSRYASRIPPEDLNADQVSRARGKYPEPATPLFQDIVHRNDLMRIFDVQSQKQAIHNDIAAQYAKEHGIDEPRKWTLKHQQAVNDLMEKAYKDSKPPAPDVGIGEVFKQAFDVAVSEPTKFAGEMLKELVANPQYMTPLTAEFGFANVVKNMGKATAAVKAGVRAADAGVMGAAITLPGTLTRQQLEHGEATLKDTGTDLAMAAATTAGMQAVVAGAVALGGKIAAKRTGSTFTPENAQKGVADATKAMEGGATPEAAVRQVLDEMKVPEAEAAAVAQAVKEAADAAKAKSGGLENVSNDGLINMADAGHGDVPLHTFPEQDHAILRQEGLVKTETRKTAEGDEYTVELVDTDRLWKERTRRFEEERGAAKAAEPKPPEEPKIDLALEEPPKFTPEDIAAAGKMADDFPAIEIPDSLQKEVDAQAGTAAVHALDTTLYDKMIADINADKGQSWRPLALAMVERAKANNAKTPELAKMHTVGDISPIVNNPKNQTGAIDKRLLAAMGLGSASALATWIYTENPMAAGLAGLTGAALTFATAKPVRSVLAAMGVHTDQRWRITDLTDRYSGMIAGGELAHQRMYRALMKNLGPTSDERLKVMRDWMEADPTTPQGHAFRQANPLSTKEAAFVHAIEVGFDGGGQKLIAIGMDPTKLLENYVSHLWVPGLNTNKGILENLRAGFAERSNDISPGMSPHSRFSMRRSIPTYAEGERMGLMPVTNNPAAILQIYLNNVNKALANKQLQGALLRERTPWGERLMVVDMPEPALKEVLKRDAITARQLQLSPAEKKILQDMHASIRAPASYVNIEHPQMKGFKVLSDIAPPLKHMFDARDPNVATKMAYNVSVAAKRALFSWSLFHAKSLLDALLGAGLKLPFKLAAARRALDDAGPAGDALMLGVKQGLRVTGRPIEGDITPFTNALRLLGEKYPVVGAPAKAVNFITQKMDHFLWEYVHPTFKAAAFLAQFEKESTKRPNVPREQIAKEVASYVNDVFGSVDWFRIADGVSNKFGRDLALAVTSPSGRRFMQIAMLAPDWTVATGRSLLKAVPGVSSKEIGAMHRAYFVRSAILYATVADALNVAFSGHHFWENEDPTTVDMGDGRRLQLSKHFMEGIHWLTKPGQQALNKLGFVISEPLKQAFNMEYLSTKGAPPIVKTNPNDSAGKQAISAAGQRMLHAAVSPLPITVQNLLSLTPGSAAAGFLGFPVLSKNEEQAVQAARERAEKQGKDVEQAEKRVRKSYQKKQEKQDALR